MLRGLGSLRARSRRRTADTPRIPASTQKLFTATAALDELGPEFRYETKAVAAAAPKNGEVQHLWLVGSGDPGITTSEAAARGSPAAPLTKGDQVTPLENLADAIVHAGVKSIPGGIDGDDSHYDTTRYLSVWPTSYRTDKEIGPLGALTVNDGFQGPDGSGPAASDPAINAATQLGRLLEARGVDVGPIGRGRAPKDTATIATLQSPPLTDVLAGFLSSSDNLTGELLTREIATHAGKEGTTANGLAVISDRLKALGLPIAGLHMVDGSGLSRDNRAPCSLELATLSLMSRPRFAWIRKGMSVAGEHGTLAKSLIGTPLQGKLTAEDRIAQRRRRTDRVHRHQAAARVLPAAERQLLRGHRRSRSGSRWPKSSRSTRMRPRPTRSSRSPSAPASS